MPDTRPDHDETPLSGEEERIIEQLASVRKTLLDQMHSVIIGQDEVIEQMIICLFCRGHALMVGVPGLAKTLMVRTIASILNLDFKRIQFTPDLMPSDITGTEVLDIDPATQQRSFKFVKGPIFTNILLADEINRTPPKTQAALLEAMQEHCVTAAGRTYPIKPPFFVLATQNPIEQEGTYPLPEAQLDRFMFNIMIGYPSRDEEIRIVKSTTGEIEPKARHILEANQIVHVQQIVRCVPVSEHVITYATDLVRASRPNLTESPEFARQYVAWGAGPRAAQYLVLGAKAKAVIEGRFNVSCGDVRAVARPVLRHRIFTNFNADSEGVTVEDIIGMLIKTVPEPDEAHYRTSSRP